jgi:hypothetical protein
VDVDDDGNAHLFKAVDDDLAAGHSYRLTQYTIGQSVTAPDWFDNNDCGQGLHVCPTAVQAHEHFPAATRFVEVTVPVADLRPIDRHKCKAQTVLVLREVDVHGRPLPAGAR